MSANLGLKNAGLWNYSRGWGDEPGYHIYEGSVENSPSCVWKSYGLSFPGGCEPLPFCIIGAVPKMIC